MSTIGLLQLLPMLIDEEIMKEEVNFIEQLDNQSRANEKAVLHIMQLAISGCRADGARHKQWYLEQIIDALGWNIDAIRIGEWEPGIAP